MKSQPMLWSPAAQVSLEQSWSSLSIASPSPEGLSGGKAVQSSSGEVRPVLWSSLALLGVGPAEDWDTNFRASGTQ